MIQAALEGPALANTKRMTSMVETPTNPMHLPDLSIRGFRGIQELKIPHLGRVTLLAGKNGIGKTTVLEAVRLYASRGRRHVLEEILAKHGELLEAYDEDGDKAVIHNFETLFNGRRILEDSKIEIGPSGDAKNGKLEIVAKTPDRQTISKLERKYNLPAYDTAWSILEVSFSGRFYSIPWILPVESKSRQIRAFSGNGTIVDDQNEFPVEMTCENLGPNITNNDKFAEFWDKAALTIDEERAVAGLNIVLDGKADGLRMIGEHSRRTYAPWLRSLGRRMIVKLKDVSNPVPLASLGDGAVRLISVALALAWCRDGFLVIDEAENGIHHLILEPFWDMVLRTANENNVQVFASTHSFDCLSGFARAAVKLPEIEGVLVRLEQQATRIRAVEYSEDELEVAADQGIEVR